MWVEVESNQNTKNIIEEHQRGADTCANLGGNICTYHEYCPQGTDGPTFADLPLTDSPMNWLPYEIAPINEPYQWVELATCSKYSIIKNANHR